MFLNELAPLANELTRHPIAFLGGFVSGLLRLNLTDDPVKSWLDHQTGAPQASSPTSGASGNNGKPNGPQSIAID